MSAPKPVFSMSFCVAVNALCALVALAVGIAIDFGLLR